MQKIKLPIISTLLLFILSGHLYAARLIVDAPQDASTNGEPFSVNISVDTEGTPLSAISGKLAFDTELFDIQSITTRSSILSLWVTQPKISNKEELGGKTIIPFEGIIPGGFTGVRSPYYDGVRPGLVFIITLLPKKQGNATITLNNIELHAFDSRGTTLVQDPVSTMVAIPTQSIAYSFVTSDLEKVYSSTLAVTLEKDPLIADGAWYVSVVEDESVRPIDRIYIAETYEYNAQTLKDTAWKEVKNVYVVSSQSRSKYIHVKVLYENNTYMIKTIPPVENSASILYSSRILIGIVFLLGFVYLYVTKNKKLFSRIHFKNKTSTTA